VYDRTVYDRTVPRPPLRGNFDFSARRLHVWICIQLSLL